MKKIFFLILALIMGAGVLFADHPDKTGIGVVGGGGWGYRFGNE